MRTFDRSRHVQLYARNPRRGAVSPRPAKANRHCAHQGGWGTNDIFERAVEPAEILALVRFETRGTEPTTCQAPHTVHLQDCALIDRNLAPRMDERVFRANFIQTHKRCGGAPMRFPTPPTHCDRAAHDRPLKFPATKARGGRGRQPIWGRSSSCGFDREKTAFLPL